MFRRNPDILAIAFVVLVIGIVSVVAEGSHFLFRNMNVERGEHFSRKVELIGKRMEMMGQRMEDKAQIVEQKVNQAAERMEQHAQRAEQRLSKVWE